MAEARRTSLEELWQGRAKAFRRETFPYLRYMAQSGFPSFLSLVLIVSIIGYAQLIRDVPPDFPVTAVGIAALTPVVCWSPLRTWLHSADIVYLMPREHRMGDYLARSFRYSVRWSAVLAAAVFLLYVPVYTGGGGAVNPWALALGAAALKAGNALSGWQERRMAWSGSRVRFRMARWLATALALGVWLTCPVWQSALFTLLCGLLALTAYRLPRKLPLPWERLIAEEAATRKRYYVFFGMFIDVPVLSSGIARRTYLSWLLPRIPYGRRHTYVYMYAASLFRTEIGGILVRILLLGCLVTYWFAEAAALSGWGAMLSLLLFAAVFGAQLGGLRQVNRYTVWRHIYPLPEQGRIGQYAKVDRATLCAGFLLLWLAASLPLLLQGIYTPPVAAAAALLAYIAIRPARISKKLLAEADED